MADKKKATKALKRISQKLDILYQTMSPNSKMLLGGLVEFLAKTAKIDKKYIQVVANVVEYAQDAKPIKPSKKAEGVIVSQAKEHK